MKELPDWDLRDAYEEAKSEIDRLRAENADLRTALQRIVIDYQDVPDATDTDGQAVFRDARAILAKTAKEG